MLDELNKPGGLQDIHRVPKHVNANVPLVAVRVYAKLAGEKGFDQAGILPRCLEALFKSPNDIDAMPANLFAAEFSDEF